MKTYFLLLALVLGLTDSISPCKAMADTHTPEANTVPQTTHRGTHIKFSEICDYFKKNGMYPLPLDFNRNLYPAMYKNKNVSGRAYPYFIKDSPFYVNVNRKDTSHNDRDTSIKNLFEKSNGDYVLGVVFNWSGDHNAEKFWLATFNSWGEAIDYIPLAMSLNNTYWMIEGQVNQDLTVNVQELEFPENDYIMDVNTHTILDNLKGQRVDRTYKITPEGKFVLTQETRYLPQIYTGEMMSDKTKTIIKGKETPLPCPTQANTHDTTDVSQTTYRGTHVKFSEICDFFKENGMYPLPLDFNRNLYPAIYKNKNVSRHGYAYFIKDSPFYVNVNRKDTSHNDRDTSIKNLFEKSNGDYVLGVVFSWSGDHNAEKFWLATFNSWGEAIDYIPLAMSLNNTYWMIEGQVNQDLTANVQELEFPENDYIMDVNTHTILDNLKGQRVDRTYKITPEGKFVLTEETRYLPQIYTGEMMSDKTKTIIKGGEKKLSRHQ